MTRLANASGRLITATLIKNRLHPDYRFSAWLEHTKKYSDHVVSLDNGSDDGTYELMLEASTSVQAPQFSLISRPDVDFTSHESKLRALLWEEVRKHASERDWILIIDADEFMEEDFVAQRDAFLEFLDIQGYGAAYFKLCDMWDQFHYRTDGLWSPLVARIFRFKDVPFGKTLPGLHRSCLPAYVNDAPHYVSDFRIKHFSLHTPEFRTKKFRYYMDHTVGVDRQHAESIQEQPTLAPFRESDRWPRVLIACPVRERQWILPDFLRHVELLDYPTDLLTVHFTVNNSQDGSEETLRAWREQSRLGERIEIETIDFPNASRLNSRDWNRNVLSNMAVLRNSHLKRLGAADCEYLFSVDSDILLHPRVLKVTILQDKPIISPVFWAKWDSDAILPQCWEVDAYSVSGEWLEFLRSTKSRQKCGGLGAQTLIHRSIAACRHVSYSPIYNISPQLLNGEDRWFCVRAVCNGFELWCHTFTESFHVDCPSELSIACTKIAKQRWFESVFRG